MGFWFLQFLQYLHMICKYCKKFVYFANKNANENANEIPAQKFF